MTDPMANQVLDKMSDRELREFMELLSKALKAADDGKVDHYLANISPGQVAFQKAIGTHTVVLLSAANRFGKTTCMMINLYWLATGTHPERRTQVPNFGRLYCNTYEVFEHTLLRKIEEWVPKSALHAKDPFTRDQGKITAINWACGSKTFILTYNQQLKASESMDLDYALFDEPPKREVYVANFRGIIDRGGVIAMAATIVEDSDDQMWILDDLIEPAEEGRKPYVKVIKGSSYENKTLPKKNIEIYEQELTDAERDARIHGDPSRLRDRVINEYKPKVSDIDSFPLTSEFFLYEGLDPHSNKPHVAIWKAIRINDGERFVVGELWCPKGIAEFTYEIIEMRNKLIADGATLVRSVNDTSLNQLDANLRENLRSKMIKILSENDWGDVLPFNASKKDWLMPGIDRLNELYRVNEATGLPRQYVFKDKVSRYRKELLRYAWPKDKSGDAIKPIQKWDDGIDCDRYIEGVAPDVPVALVGVQQSRKNVDAYKILSPSERLKARKPEGRGMKVRAGGFLSYADRVRLAKEKRRF